ncbi:MAG: hypothetical protein UU08_C0001G0043 [Candidatus Uhrbacteria bacterium GW2011_GWE2_40_58]|nr:MAG: hypothetical protein UT94_C0001G0043 [Candidatus Uhrbacteria bacterium GW2011_GWF2_40_263]KKR68269.1 MAG: hypothetical protein UU08_C0001G0043 [Candidatus Uhrbacteria bacterium GW2011_GWE2_40_58]OGL92070.1 MAG: hypothetical protein A2239_03600 [Candidatus Uhrbacteria bacterium RIFOXYA2_FULL_40_9]OGL97528.1 MAG: hypothetical protein A2332_00305 [Candidatus Uhrbacteria bacterium RIFOXYB2_FULL_41_18]HAM37363.1 hypothetical protein [Patescibacteria group bacterium]HBK35083.1 hypothetical p
MSLDKKATRAISSLAHRSVILDCVGIFGARYLFLLMVLYGVAWLWKHMEDFWTFLFSILIGWVIALVLEYTIRRERPYKVKNLKPLSRPAIETPSFPSGHATISFAAAVSIWFVDPTLGLVFSGLAILVALSRVYVGVHYVSDIIAGALLGAFVSCLVTFFF